MRAPSSGMGCVLTAEGGSASNGWQRSFLCCLRKSWCTTPGQTGCHPPSAGKQRWRTSGERRPAQMVSLRGELRSPGQASARAVRPPRDCTITMCSCTNARLVVLSPTPPANARAAGPSKRSPFLLQCPNSTFHWETTTPSHCGKLLRNSSLLWKSAYWRVNMELGEDAYYPIQFTMTSLAFTHYWHYSSYF